GSRRGDDVAREPSPPRADRRATRRTRRAPRRTRSSLARPAGVVTPRLDNRAGRGQASGRMLSRVLTFAAFLVVSACQSGAPSSGRIIVLGIDGMDPETVDLLMSEGKMPSFARLRQEGAYARLRSQKPLLSPIIWTTIATGKPPEQHGIG